MGIDTSLAVGYGLILDELPEVFGVMEPFSDDVSALLTEHGFNQIAHRHCGDFMNGEEVEFFYIKRLTNFFTDILDMPTVTHLNAKVNTDEVDEIYRLQKFLGLDITNLGLGWKVIVNVS